MYIEIRDWIRKRMVWNKFYCGICRQRTIYSNKYKKTEKKLFSYFRWELHKLELPFCTRILPL